MHTIEQFTNRILYGDCIKVMRRMPSASIDLVVTDPPYLVGYRSRDGRSIAGDRDGCWLRPAFREVARVLKPDRFCISFYGWQCVERFMAAWKAAGLRPVGHFVWAKDYPSRRGFTRACHEQAYLLAKGEPEEPVSPLWDVQTWHYSGNTRHPTEKHPLSLMPLILSYSEQGETVLDPFAGSGSTAEAAFILRRNYIGIEKMWTYCRSARERLTGLQAGQGSAGVYKQ
jgi:adenine-specific DNA-methyltransferase